MDERSLANTYFMDEIDGLCSMKALQEKPGVAMICKNQIETKKGIKKDD